MNPNDSAAAALESHILENIPLADAMDLKVRRYTGDMLEMTAPLAPNVNDKGCAFGGSMASLLTLAGWGLVELGLRARGVACDIYVGDSQLRYHEPVWSELRGVARFAEGDALEKLSAALKERGKGRAYVVCEIMGDKRAAATLTALFVAKLRAGSVETPREHGTVPTGP
ncbi:MAG: putative acetyltransferase [Rhodanobacteraceae bacterium]|jgi:thioesterase domain-containing protein|nr:MAG: putative acetyltransferase [Rhodanobacteraceae bacterium]